MLGIARTSDKTSCKGVCLPKVVTVFVNDLQVHRVGDLNSCGLCSPPPTSAVITGSTTVFANGKAVALLGSPDSCVGLIEIASTNVLVGS